VSSREERVVSCNGSCAHDNRIAQGAEPVKVHDIFPTGHVMRFPGWHRDEAIEALTKMPDHDRTAAGRAADWEVQIEQIVTRVVAREQDCPAHWGLPRDDGLQMARRHWLEAPVVYGKARRTIRR
jgi:hypothetical protein